MDGIEAAIEAAFKKKVANLYDVFSRNIVVASDDERRMAKAREQFRAGLAFEIKIRDMAREDAGL